MLAVDAVVVSVGAGAEGVGAIGSVGLGIDAGPTTVDPSPSAYVGPATASPVVISPKLAIVSVAARSPLPIVIS